MSGSVILQQFTAKSGNIIFQLSSLSEKGFHFSPISRAEELSQPGPEWEEEEQRLARVGGPGGGGQGLHLGPGRDHHTFPFLANRHICYKVSRSHKSLSPRIAWELDGEGEG